MVYYNPYYMFIFLWSLVWTLEVKNDKGLPPYPARTYPHLIQTFLNLFEPSYLNLSRTYPELIQTFLNLSEAYLWSTWYIISLAAPHRNADWAANHKRVFWKEMEIWFGRNGKKYKTLGFIVQRNDYCKSWSVTHQMMVRTRRNWLTYELLHKKNLKGYIACNTVLKSTTLIFNWEGI